jgi:hypothetical protein
MLAHFLDFGYFHVIALKGKNETIKTGQFDRPLGLSAALQIVASESREPFQFIDILYGFDNIHTLDILSGNFSAIGSFCFPVIGVLFLKFARSKSDFQNSSLRP